MSNKVIVKEFGKEKLVCESIDDWHGEIFVKLMNNNFETKYKKREYRLVPHRYQMNENLCSCRGKCKCPTQITVFDLTE